MAIYGVIGSYRSLLQADPREWPVAYRLTEAEAAQLVALCVMQHKQAVERLQLVWLALENHRRDRPRGKRIPREAARRVETQWRVTLREIYERGAKIIQELGQTMFDPLYPPPLLKVRRTFDAVTYRYLAFPDDPRELDPATLTLLRAKIHGIVDDDVALDEDDDDL